MPRTRVRTDTVYQFGELSPEAQRKAIDARREIEGEGFADSIRDLFDPGYCWGMDAETIGLTFDRRTFRTMGGGQRNEAAVYWALHQQGAGAWFDGTWTRPADPIARANGSEGGEDRTLRDLAAKLAQVPAGTTATIKYHERGYSRAGLEITVYDGETGHEVEDDTIAEIVREAMRAFAQYLYRVIDAEYDYRTGDAAIREYLTEDTGTEYTEDGRIA